MHPSRDENVLGKLDVPKPTKWREVGSDGEITREPQMSWYRSFKEFPDSLVQMYDNKISDYYSFIAKPTSS
jgi:hypothetical protein